MGSYESSLVVCQEYGPSAVALDARKCRTHIPHLQVRARVSRN